MIRHAKASSAIAVICGIVLALGAAQALAAKTTVKSLGASNPGNAGGLFSTPRGVAVNQSGKGGVAAGTFYVVDSNNNRIQQFSPAGEFLRTWGVGVGDGGGIFQICETASSCTAGAAGPGAGQLNNPQGIAVDQATGNLYVSDQGNRRIDVFGPNGAFQGAFGYGAKTGANELQFCTTSCVNPNTAIGAPGGKFGAAIGGLAVDPTTGNLYVASKTNRRVEVFKPIFSGTEVTGAEFLRAFGWDVLTGGIVGFEVCTVAADCKQGATTAGKNPGQFGTLRSPGDVAVDSEGNIYAADNSNKRVQKFSSTPALITEKFGATAIADAFGDVEIQAIALDPSSAPNRLLVSAARSTSEERIAVLEMDHNGNKLHLHGEELTPAGFLAASGLAVAKRSLGGNLYVSTPKSLAGPGTGMLEGVNVLNEGPELGAITGVDANEATFNGTLVSNDAKVHYRFEYIGIGGGWSKLPTTDADAGISSASAEIASTGPSTGTLAVKARVGAFTLSFNAETTAPLDHDASASAVQAALEALPSIGAGNVSVSGGPGSPDGSTPYAISFIGALAGTEVTQISAFAANLLAPTIAVSQVATGLHGNTKYLVRLVATRPAGGFAITSAQGEFTTPASAPAVSATTASAITGSSAKLEGKVNPENQATSYHFEYLTQADYEANGNSFSGPQSVSKAPTSPVNIGTGIANIAVAEQLSGLEPNTAYRFRLVATNATGTTNGPEGVFTTHSGQPSFDPCANDQFRSGPSANLPDCRAWEQASPLDKNGGSLQGTALAARTAEDGSTITFESTTGISGGAGAQNFPTYMAKRGTGGWSTTGLLPSPSSGQRAGVIGWTSDFATAFSEAELFSEGTSLVARDTAGGPQAEIIPHTPPPNNPEYAYVGSSRDGDTVVFEARPENPATTTLQLTPDAAAGKPNLYAWDRETGELRLVGILPDGSTPVEGSRAGRGAETGALDYLRDAGFVTDGGSVFFNDRGDGQLYLRLDPTAAGASTVHVSASQKENGKGPGGRDSAGSQPASLIAASPDGSAVTFTSHEKLTDDATTGPEPDAPAIARAKASDGGEKDLEFIPAFAHEIAIDEVEGYVYWSDPENGQIGRAKLDGTEFDESYVSGLGEPRGIAVVNDPVAKYIFWTEQGPLDANGDPQVEQGSIGRADLDGTDVNPSCHDNLTNPRSIAGRPDFIYWTSPDIGAVTPGEGNVDRAELTCNPGSAMTLIDGFASGDIAVNANHIYFSFAQSNSFIRRYNLDGTEAGAEDGSQPILQISDVQSPPSLAVNGSHLFWTNPVAQGIGRSDLEGTDATEEHEFIAEAGRPGDLAASATHLFWSANQGVQPNPGNDIYQLDRDSGILEDLAPDSTSANGVEVQGVLGASEDGSYVYFAANGIPDGLGNSPNEMGEEAQAGDCEGAGNGATGSCNLYVAHEGEVDFIARLDAERHGSEVSSGDALNWIADQREAGKSDSGKTARVSTDGQVLVFRSHRQLIDYDNEGPRCAEASNQERMPGSCLEFFRFDHEQMSLACLTCDPRGTTPEGPAKLESVAPPDIGAPVPAATLARNLSRDGNRFFFETPDALAAADINGEDGCPAWGNVPQTASSRACQDVYEWEAPGTGSCVESSPAYSTQNQGCIYLISTGKSKEATFFADADLDGENVFIYTYEQLVPQDEDALLDAYDARIDGGMASQHQVEVPCAAEACKTPPSPPLAPQSPGSSGFAGPTDPKPTRANQRKQKRRRQARQKQRRAAKAKQRKEAKQRQRAASKSRRAGR